MNALLTSLLWVALSLPFLLLLQRWIHRHLHGVSLLISGNPNWAVVIYAIVLFPGVALHEFSHWIMAGILGVRTGGFSLLPRLKKDGTVQLGYVEYYKTRTLGAVRESLIGGAPLIAGTLAILAIGFRIFDIPSLAVALRSGDVETLIDALGRLFATNDFLVWLYLLFAVSNAMLPSPSDRRAWPAFFGLLAVLVLLFQVLDLQALFWQGLAPGVAALFGYLGVAFSLAIGVDLMFMLLIALLERLLSRLRRVDIYYESRE